MYMLYIVGSPGVLSTPLYIEALGSLDADWSLWGQTIA